MAMKALTFDEACSDAELVSASLAGHREAFGQIVSRYQGLVCSLAYNATGSLNESEDLAQETFLAVWKQLPHLREPAKLRSWLCQIARNHICDAFRRQGREPIDAAESLDLADETQCPAPLAPEKAISHEEEAILWRSLEKIPETYREPLILFYREGESIQRVATKLDLSEDAVKQRLSRGRKLLAEQVAAFVEGALKQSAPGRAFTVGVLAALPMATMSATAATAGATAAQGSATAKAAAATGLLGIVLGPLMFLFGTYVGYRASLDSSSSDRQRAFVKKGYRLLLTCIFLFSIMLTPVLVFSKQLLATSPPLFVGTLIALSGAYAISILALTIWTRREHRKLASMEQAGADRAPNRARQTIEYRSRINLLGLPLYHIRLGGSLGETQRSVKAWFAVGDSACGVIFAFGGIAVAPIAIGGLAVGLFSFGGFALAPLALGGFAVGIWATGGMAFGVESFAACAVGWHTAVGGVAVAHNFALGGVAYAAEANNSTAWQIVRANPFFRVGMTVLPYIAWFNVIWILPLYVWWRVVAKRPTGLNTEY